MILATPEQIKKQEEKGYLVIYATEQQIKRMTELVRQYPLGYVHGDDLYGYLIELNETQRTLTYEEENIIIETGKDR